MPTPNSTPISKSTWTLWREPDLGNNVGNAPPPDVDTSKGWHAPGLGEVHSADHKLMVHCEQEDGPDGDMVVSDLLAKRICLALSQPQGDTA